MAKNRSYKGDLLESLKDPVEALEYLNAALEDGEPEVFLLALRDVVDSQGGISKLALSTSLNRENLYRMLSSKGNPEFFSLSAVLRSVGFRLAVEPKLMSSRLILYAQRVRTKQQPPNYCLAAESESNEKTETVLLTSDDKEMGVLEFDHKNGELIFFVRPDVSLKNLKQAEILTADGNTLVSEISIEGKDRIVLLKKMKLFPKNVSQITLEFAE